MSKIDSAGVYVGDVIESGIGTTKKGFPQWVSRLVAKKKWIENPDEMKHFKLEEPGYVDWSSFNEEIVAYQVLFNSAAEFTPDTKLLNYEQLMLALGWDGTEFDSLGDGSMTGKSIQFRVEEDTYEGKTALKVNWIDAADAPASRQLKTLAADDVKALSAKLKFNKPAPKPAAAVAAKPKAPVTKPATVTSPATETLKNLATMAAPAPAAAAPVPPKPAKKKAPATEVPPPPAATPAESTGLPKETTQMDAWTLVVTNKGENSDDVIQDAWIAACQEVGGERDEDTFTAQEWAKIRDIVIKDASLTVPA